MSCHSVAHTAIPSGVAVQWTEERTPSGLKVHVASPVVPTPEQRPRLLLIHGLAGGAWHWDRFQVEFAAHGYTSHAVDLRGHHGSRPVQDMGRVSLADYVEDVLEVARSLGRPVVVGHSLGGLLAQAVAEMGVAGAAVLLCPMPPKGIGFATPGLVMRQLRHVGVMLFSRPLHGTPADLIATSLNRIPVADRMSLASRFVADSGRVARELSLGGLSIDAGRVRVPVLVVSATEDRLFSAQVGRKVAARYDADFMLYESHGHFIVQEPGAEVIAGDVARWISGAVAAHSASVLPR